MGSFNSVCLLSDAPIRCGERVYVLPLQVPRYADMNRGTETHYILWSAPFEAEYNDYGFFENVVDSTAWQEFLKKTGCADYEALDEYFSENRPDMIEDSPSAKKNNWTYAFVHKAVYERFTDGTLEWDNNLLGSYPGSPLVMQKLGFERTTMPDPVPEGLDTERHVDAYRHITIEQLMAYADDHGYAVFYHQGKTLDFIYRTKDALKKLMPLGLELADTGWLREQWQWPDHAACKLRKLLTQHLGRTPSRYDLLLDVPEVENLSAYARRITLKTDYGPSYCGDTFLADFEWEDPLLQRGLKFINRLHTLQKKLRPQHYHRQEAEYAHHLWFNELRLEGVKVTSKAWDNRWGDMEDDDEGDDSPSA